MELWLIAALAFIELLALLLLWFEGLLRETRHVVFSVVFLTLGFGLRALCMDHETLDYINFLSKWIDFFRENGGVAALADPIGNYNVPYLYFLALFSYADVSGLHLIKLTSVAFDVALAWGAMRLTGVFSNSAGRQLLTFLGVFLLPTVILNGALWGQCDSIYVAFAVISVYLALKNRPVLSVAFIALSFAFKLQAVFVLPLFAVFLYTKKIKLRHLAAFPVSYFIVILPAVLCDRPLWDTITLYFSQTGSVGSGLNYNSPSVFAFFDGNVDAVFYSRAGVVFAFAFVFAVLLWLYIKRRRVTNEVILSCALLFSVCIPFLLPHMHERYFFAADIFSFVFAVLLPRYIAVPVCCSFASLLGYHAYLKARYLLPMSYGSIALIIVIILIISHMIHLLYTRRRKNYGGNIS